MLQDRDLTFLSQMQRIGEGAKVSAPGETFRRLLELYDQLNFDDDEWRHELEQHLVTLDSASTFHPADELQERQLEAAVHTATSEILGMISTKIRAHQ
jgi:hypothetical protein